MHLEQRKCPLGLDAFVICKGSKSWRNLRMWSTRAGDFVSSRDIRISYYHDRELAEIVMAKLKECAAGDAQYEDGFGLVNDARKQIGPPALPTAKQQTLFA